MASQASEVKKTQKGMLTMLVLLILAHRQEDPFHEPDGIFYGMYILD